MCYINGACFNANDTNPALGNETDIANETCIPTKDQFAWSQPGKLHNLLQNITNNYITVSDDSCVTLLQLCYFRSASESMSQGWMRRNLSARRKEQPSLLL